MYNVYVPVLDWFVGDIFSKQGNCYVGSVGAEGIESNAFCYKVWLQREDDGCKIICEVYDCLTTTNFDKHQRAEFLGDEQGFNEAKKWINSKYTDYISAGRDKIRLTF